MMLRSFSVRSYVLAWIIIPLFSIIAVDTYFLYRSVLNSMTVAYDRTLLATAYTVADSIRYEKGEYLISQPLAMQEIYENEQHGRYVYRISSPDGRLISGDAELPFYTGPIPERANYPEAVQFYEDEINDESIRVAALRQPVISRDDAGSVIVQVAEPLGIRKISINALLKNTIYRQVILLLIVGVAVFVAVSRSLRPLQKLCAELDHRPVEDLSALNLTTRLIELKTVIQALNKLMARVGRLINHQKRFIANASHQLRTPLAVLKTQLQSGLQGDTPAKDVLQEMQATVERTIKLANQMLLLAKIDQKHTQGMTDRCNLGFLAREAALELSPLIAEKYLDFEIEYDQSYIQGDAWLIGELIRNLLNNAIEHTPVKQKLGVRIGAVGEQANLLVWNEGNGFSEQQIKLLFEPFSTDFSCKGSGLGLVIAKEIVASLQGQISLHNQVENDKVIQAQITVTFNKID